MSEFGYIFTEMEKERDRLAPAETSYEKGKRAGIIFCIDLFWKHFLKKTEKILGGD